MPASSTAIAGLPNFRDLGGLTTTAGERIKCGKLFRSQGFEAVDAAGLNDLAALNIRLVCDLRSVMERERAPSRWPQGQGTKFLAFDVRTDARADRGKMMEQIMEEADGGGARRRMLGNYAQMPTTFAAVLPQVFAHLTEEQHLPAVIHCHAGKDRTGFVAAMILFALGVPRELVFEDYMRTARHIDPLALVADLVDMFDHFHGHDLPAAALLPIAEVDAKYLETALTSIESQFGSVERYLADVAGLDAARRTRLRELLLER